MARVVALIDDLLFGSKVQSALAAAGHEVTLGGPVEGADVVVVDLTVARDDLAAVAAGPARTLGFYAHVEPAVRDAALAAGFDLVVPRSRMHREGAELVARLVA